MGILISVFVHQLDTTGQATVPPGWRWAVHLGTDPHDLRSCLNAGWCPTRNEAALEGEMVGVTAAKALAWVTGQPDTYHHANPIILERDPVPLGA